MRPHQSIDRAPPPSTPLVVPFVAHVNQSLVVAPLLPVPGHSAQPPACYQLSTTATQTLPTTQKNWQPSIFIYHTPYDTTYHTAARACCTSILQHLYGISTRCSRLLASFRSRPKTLVVVHASGTRPSQAIGSADNIGFPWCTGWLAYLCVCARKRQQTDSHLPSHLAIPYN